MRHCIEQVRETSKAALESEYRLVVTCIAVAGADDETLVHELRNGSAIDRFRREGALAQDEQEIVAQDAGLEVEEKRVAVAGGSGAPAERPYSFVNQADAPSCMDCGSIMIRNGACYKCANCGGTSGCS